jgi:DNA-binding PadR family transcriptional regulator
VAAERPLNAAEWSLLGLLCEEPRHGWALAGELSPDGPLGRIWSLTRPLVYRAVELLTARGLVEVAGEAASTRGPNRTLLRPTEAGRAALDAWLVEPVRHVRDVRPDLLLKLVLAARLGRDARPLLHAQQPVLEDVVRGLEPRAQAAKGADAVVVRYRLETARAAARFVADELSR